MYKADVFAPSEYGAYEIEAVNYFSYFYGNSLTK